MAFGDYIGALSSTKQFPTHRSLSVDDDDGPTPPAVPQRTCHRQTVNMPQATGNRQHATGNILQATGNRQQYRPQATCNMKHARGNMQHATCNRQHANMQHATYCRQQATGSNTDHRQHFNQQRSMRQHRSPSTKTKTTGPRRQQCALTDSWCTSMGCMPGCTKRHISSTPKRQMTPTPTGVYGTPPKRHSISESTTHTHAC